MNSNLSLFAQGELLILPDGKILAHNVTPELAAILTELDPENKLMRQRVHEATSKKRRHRAKHAIKPFKSQRRASQIQQRSSNRI